MNYTQSDANVVHVGTGRRMHQSTAPVTTEVSAEDMNQLVWGCMELLNAAGVSPASFDAGNPSTYQRLLEAVTVLAGPGNKHLPTIIVGGDGADKRSELLAANDRGRPLWIFGACQVATPTEITVPIVDGMAQIFAPSAKVTIRANPFVRPQWFGSSGTIRTAVDALPASGGVVMQSGPPVLSGYSGCTPAKIAVGACVPGEDYLAKANVRVQGSALPTFKSDFSGLVGGSIVQGPFAVQADGFQIDLIGVDSGSSVCAAHFAGAMQEGLLVLQTNKLAPWYSKGVQVGRVRGLCTAPSAAVHALLFEAVDGLNIEFAEGANAFHGVVLKSRNVTFGVLRGIETGGNGVVMKSDAYANLEAVKGAVAEGLSADPAVDAGFAVLVEAVTAPGGSVQIANVRGVNKANGLGCRSNGAALSDVSVGSLITDGCPVGYILAGDARRVEVTSQTSSNATNAVVVDAGVTHPSNRIASLRATNVAGDAIALSGKLSVGQATFDALGGYAVNYVTTAARLVLASHVETDVANFWPLQPTLAGSWVNEGGVGNPLFRVTMDAGRVKLSGFIKGGSGPIIVAALSTQIRPPENLEFKLSGRNGASRVTVTLEVSVAGVLTIADYANAGTYISLDGAEWVAPL